MRKRQLWSLVILVCLGVLPAGAGEPGPEELEALKAQLAVQQQQIQQLQEMLRRQGAVLEVLQQQLAGKGPKSDQTSAAAPPDLERVSQKVDAVAEQAAELNAAVGGLEKRVEGLGNFSFSGDIRVRYEPFFQDGMPQRHRERGRLRFLTSATLTRELSGGFRVASGGLDDPISPLQSFTGFFTRKPIDLDQFWLAYKPERLPWLSVTAGKFEYPWVRTELTFDNDLNPEGFSEKLSFNFPDSRLASLTLVAFQLPFNELAAAGDSIIWGGQVQTQWRLNERTRLGLHAAGLNFRNADSVARAMATGAVQPALPLSNSVRVDAAGAVVGFAERFAYLDLIGELSYRLQPRWPLRLTLNFVNNLRAVSGERSGYWAGLALGRTEEKGDWLFGYALMRLERDAVIGAYNYSDLRSSTNVLNHRLRLAYLPHKNLTLEYTLFVGRLFNPQDNLNLVPPAFRPLFEDPYLSRMQFDLTYKF